MALKSVVKGVDLVAKNIIRYGDGFIRTVNKTMKEVDFVLDKKLEQNISLTDHSLGDLRRLGHPYAARHGSQGLNIHSPGYQVHKQSGKLLSSKVHGTKNAEITGGKLEASAFAGLDESRAPHALYVVFGTSKMIPRPVLQGTRDEVVPQAIDIIKSNLKNFTFSFKP